MEIGITIFIIGLALTCILGSGFVTKLLIKEIKKERVNNVSDKINKVREDEEPVGLREFISFKKKYDHVGLPVIAIKILDNEYDFILDTGANFNALDKNEFKRIVQENNIDVDLSKLDSGDTNDVVVTGVGGQQQNIKEVKIPLTISDLDFEEVFSLVDIGPALSQYGSEDIRLCGVIGSDFFERYNWQIDFKDLVVWLDSK